MRPSTFLAILAAPILALGKVVITSTSYSHGEVKLGIQSYSDAPESFAVNLVAADGTVTKIASSTTTGTGVLDIALPSVAAGSYKVQVTSGDGSETFSTSKSFSVAASDFASSSRASASYTLSITGSAKPLYTTSLVTNSAGSTVLSSVLLGPAAGTSVSGVTTTSGTDSASTSAVVSTVTSTSVTTIETSVPVTTSVLFSTDSVITSGSVTTTVPVTTLVPTTSVASTQSAATAQIVTTTQSGAGALGVHGGVMAFLAAVVAGALLI